MVSGVREKQEGPAIAEMVAGNTFRTRIAPLPKRGFRIVKIVLSSELTDDSHLMTYSSPLIICNSLQQFSFKVQIDVDTHFFSGPQLCNELVSLFGSAIFQTSSIGHMCCYEFDSVVKSCIGPHAISFVLHRRPDVTESTTHLLVENGLQDDIENASFFCVAGELSDVAAVPRPKVKSIGVLWDTSLSRAEEPHHLEFSLLQAIAGQNPGAQFYLYTYNSYLSPEKRFESITDLINCLQSTLYSGATNFMCLENLHSETSYLMLFSDGFLSWGDQDITPTFDKPVYTFSCGAMADYTFLKRIASSSGASFFNLGISSSQEIATQMNTLPFMLLRAVYNMNQISDVFPIVPCTVHRRFCITGKLPSHIEPISLTLEFGWFPGEAAKITKTYTFSPTNRHHGLITRFWATKQVDHLLTLSQTEIVQKKVLSLGQKFRFVTPNASLIVLNTLEQYLKYEIEPPECLPDMRRDYNVKIAKQKALAEQRKENKFGKTKLMWERRKLWWNHLYDGSPKPLWRNFMNPKEDSNDFWGSPYVKEMEKEPTVTQTHPSEMTAAITSEIAPALSPYQNEWPTISKIFHTKFPEKITSPGTAHLLLEEIFGKKISEENKYALLHETGTVFQAFVDFDSFTTLGTSLYPCIFQRGSVFCNTQWSFV
ncbi:vault protein inter-alpha-trypsin domain protein [Pelomyxa schiedti]|nr:vault protein inter-alpha-trypsin domain protein [Pelomyxa schiedti]